MLLLTGPTSAAVTYASDRQSVEAGKVEGATSHATDTRNESIVLSFIAGMGLSALIYVAWQRLAVKQSE